MLVIRLQRTGRKNLPSYRIVVAEKARAVKKKSAETVGFYLPARTNPELSFDKERVSYWVSKGAVPSDTLARLFKKEGVQGMDKFILAYTKQRSKKAPEEEPAAPAPAAEAAQEKPADEPAVEQTAAPEEEKKEDKPAEEAPKDEPAPETTPGDNA